MQKSIRRLLTNGCLSFLFLLFFAFLFRQTAVLQEGLRQGLTLCLGVILPSLFPFLVLTDAFTDTAVGRRILHTLSYPISRLLGISRYGASAYLCGVLFGFPIGVKALAAYYKDGLLDKKEAEHLLLFCNNTGPAFLIGAVGALTGSRRLGLFLYLLQVLISLLIGLLICRPWRYGKQKFAARTARPPRTFRLTESIGRASEQMLRICGCILFFSAVFSLLPPISHSGIKAIVLSLLEVGGAVSFIAKELAPPLLMPHLGFAVCFSGLSVWLQCKVFLNDIELNTAYYIPVKLLSGGIAFLLCLSSFFH